MPQVAISPAMSSGILGAQFCEAGGGEVAVEGERLLNPLCPHVGEAGRVDEGVLALVVLAQPAEGLVLVLLGQAGNLDVPALASDRVQKLDRPAVPELAADRGPSLTPDVVGRDEGSSAQRREEPQRNLMALVPIVGAGDEERGVDEDQGSGFDGP